MNLARNLIQAAVGGLFGGAAVGLAEATWLLSQGAPDYVAPVYALVLYGAFGLPLGIAAGVVLSVVERFRKLGKRADALGFAFGTVGAVVPIGFAVLAYLVKKVVYAEAGLPLPGLLGILGFLGAYAAFALTVGVRVLSGPAKVLLRGPGALGTYAALLLVTGLLALAPTGDPRASWAHGKPVPAALAEKPNVLLITIDTLRADHLGTYGMAGDPTPTLDAIGRDGVVFEQAFAAASWTRSSFAALFTSRIPSSHGTATKAARLPDDVDLLSEVLQGAGMTTGNLANNINVTRTFNFDQGYDTFVYESPGYALGATEGVFGLSLYKGVQKVYEKVVKHKVVTRFYQPADVVLADAKGFIQANRDSRFYLGVHLMEPHDPYFEHPYLDGSGTAEFNGKAFGRAEHEKPALEQADYLRRVYLDEIRHLDRKLADFVGWLKAEGLYDDLLIVVTSDHGEEFGEHGGFWHGITLYDEQIHVPLIVKLPKGQLAGTRVPWQARLIDVAPTIASVLDIEPSKQWEGLDLVARVTGWQQELAEDTAKLREAELLLAEAEAGDPRDEDMLAAASEARSVIERAAEREKPCARYGHPKELAVIAEQDFEGNKLSAIRKGGFKLLSANEGNPRGLPTQELFDVVEDPHETRNLIGLGEPRCGTYLDGLPRSLGVDRDTVIDAARKRALSGGQAEMSAAEIAKLCALGYLSGADCGQ